MKSEAETSMPTLLEWLDAELEYHGMMMECCQAGRDGIFTEHNIAHLHLTRIRALVMEQPAPMPTGMTSDALTPGPPAGDGLRGPTNRAPTKMAA